MAMLESVQAIQRRVHVSNIFVDVDNFQIRFQEAMDKASTGQGTASASNGFGNFSSRVSFSRNWFANFIRFY